MSVSELEKQKHIRDYLLEIVDMSRNGVLEFDTFEDSWIRMYGDYNRHSTLTATYYLKNKYLSQKEIYEKIYTDNYSHLMSHKVTEEEFEEYEEWCRRKATQEAVKNTVKEWRKQYDA